MVFVCKLITKKSEKKKKKGETGWYQRQWYNFFFRGVVFLFLNEGCSLNMSKFLHLLFFNHVISCFMK